MSEKHRARYELATERVRARYQRVMTPVLESGENVLYAVQNFGLPSPVMYAIAFTLVGAIPLAPYEIAKGSVAVATERNVYVFKTNGITSKPRRVLLKAPLGSVKAHCGSRWGGDYLIIEDQKIWLNTGTFVRTTAEALAALASGDQPGFPTSATA